MKILLNKSKSNTTIDILLLALICVVFILPGGTPYRHPDFVLSRALEAVKNGGNPNFFNYPGLVIYINTVIYSLIYCFMNLCNIIHNPTGFQQLYLSESLTIAPFKISFYLPSQIITALFSLLGVTCTYLATYKLTEKRLISFLSGLFVATSLLWVSESHFLTVDIPLASLSIATIFTILIIIEKRCLNFKSLLVLGVLSGCTISAKYNGFIVFVAVFVTLIFVFRDDYRGLIKKLLFLGVVTLAVFFISNPFILLDFKVFLSDFLFELNHAKAGHLGYQTNNAWLFHLTHSLYLGYSLPLLLLSFLGLFWLAATKSVRVSSKLAITVFPLLFYLLMGSSNLAFQRYILPMMPFLGIFSSLGIYAFFGAIKTICSERHRAFKVSLISLVINIIAISILPNIQNSLRHNIILSRQDTRKDLFKAFTDTQIKGLDIISLAGNLINVHDVNLINTQNEKQKDQEPLTADISLHLTIFNSFTHDRYIYDTTNKKLRDPHNIKNDSYVIQISPFRVPKDEVPFSPKSLYSPYPPDLVFRKKPGPYIEIYCDDHTLAQKIIQACNRQNVDCSLLPAEEGFYLQKLFKN